MGTSSGYSPGSGPNWKNTKRDVTRAAVQDGTSSDIAPALRSHLRAYKIRLGMPGGHGSFGGGDGMQGGGAGGGSGGGGRVSGSSGFKTARKVAGGLSSFVHDVGDVGLNEALDRRGLGYLKNRPVNEVIDGIVGVLTDGAEYIDDVDARIAASNVIDEIVADADSPEELEEKLKELSDDKALCGLLSKFFRHFLIEHFFRNYWEHLQDKISNNNIKRFKEKVKDHLFSGFEFELGDQDISIIDWSSDEGRELIASVEQRTYEVYVR